MVQYLQLNACLHDIEESLLETKIVYLDDFYFPTQHPIDLYCIDQNSCLFFVSHHVEIIHLYLSCVLSL